MPSAKHEIVAPVSPQSLMNVITDFKSYPDFLPEIISTDIRRNGPPVWEVRFQLRLIRPIVYVLQLELKSEYELTWSLIEGFFVSNTGGWCLTPHENGTHIQYEISMQLDTFLPGNIANSLTKRSLPATVKRFVDEAMVRQAAHQKIDEGDN